MQEPVCVSVLIPAFNSAATLAQAATSALRQSLSDIELLIIDDGSEDHTRAVAMALAARDKRVRVIPLDRNRGKPHAMNVAMGQARGRWIAVLDADDWYAEERLARLVAEGERRRVDLVADNQHLYDAGAGQIVGTAFPAGGGSRRLDKASFIAGSNPYADFDFGMLKPVLRTCVIRQAGLRYRESARLSEDFLFLAEFLSAGGEGWLVAQPFYYWRQAFGRLSRQWTSTGHGEWRYDFLSGARANAEVQKLMQARGDRALAAVLLRRACAFRKLHWLQEIKRQRAGGAPLPSVVRSVLRHPTVWPLVIQRSGRQGSRAFLAARRLVFERLKRYTLSLSRTPTAR
jgi:succinoglycan biosynthesis protein ExoO